MLRTVTLSLAAVCVLTACPNSSQDDVDSGVDVIDDGKDGGTSDAGGDGDGDTGGDGDGDTGGDGDITGGDGDGDTGGDGDGDTGGDGDGDVADGGFEFDGGFVEYVGEPEDGVRCGEELNACGTPQLCCVAVTSLTPTFEATCSDYNETDAGPDTCTAGHEFPFQCDDAQNDCAEGSICCMHSEFDFGAFPPVTDFSSRCLPENECLPENDDFEICTTSAECNNGWVCCGVEPGGFTLPIDFGVCQESCEEQ